MADATQGDTLGTTLEGLSLCDESSQREEEQRKFEAEFIIEHERWTFLAG
jgi:hypothetical protein